MEEHKISLTGIPNCGISTKRTENFVVKVTESCIQIYREGEKKPVISYNPFFDGGSVWLEVFSSIILDRADESVARHETLHASTFQIEQWKKDSRKLELIKEAYTILKEVE